MWSTTYVPDHKLTAIWWRGKQSVELNIWAIAGTGWGCLGGFWLWSQQSNAEQKLSVSGEGTLLHNSMISWRTEMKRSIEEGEVNKETGLMKKENESWLTCEDMNSAWTATLVAFIEVPTGRGVRVRLWEPDISPTARHNILFFWVALTQISAPHFLFSQARSEQRSFTGREESLAVGSQMSSQSLHF